MQRQRRAELVADVGEERRLGAVELGQRLGPLLLLLVGLRRWRCWRRSAAPPGRGSRGSSSSRSRNGLRPTTSTPARPVGRADASGTAPPASAAACQAPAGSVAGTARPDRRPRAGVVCAQHLGERPGRRRRRARSSRARRRAPRVDAGGAGQRRALRCVGLDQVDQRERQIARVGRQRRARQRARLLERARVRGARGQLAQQRQLPLADDARRVVGVGADDAAGAPLVVGHRAVGEGVVGLLGVAVALHDQQQRLVVGPLVARASPAAARGPTWSQISRHTTAAGCPSASGCLPPTIAL